MSVESTPTGFIDRSSKGGNAMNPRARGFLARLTLVTAGGMFIDGYVFAVIGVTMALQTFNHSLHITPVWAGLISSATLIGIFVGAFIFGWLTDKVGRRPLFVADLAAFAIASILMFFVQDAWQMFALALILGLAVGADYAIGSPLISEFAPRTARGILTSTLQIAWNVGYVIAYLIGYLVTAANPDAWRWVLASACVPAILTLIGRHGLPESPRWLISKGRVAEAQTVLESLGWSLESDDYIAEVQTKSSVGALFARGQLARTVFVCVFWICLVLPYFAIIFFQARVLGALGVTNPIFAALLGTIVALAGVTLGVLLVERVGRRKLLIIPFWITAAALVVVAFEHALPTPIIVACFFVYLFAYGVASMLCGVYPMELFPTAIRTSGVGFASSASRIGAAVGTFLFPMMLAWSVPASMAIMAGVCVVGAIISQLMAPETSGRALTEVASAPLLRSRNS